MSPAYVYNRMFRKMYTRKNYVSLTKCLVLADSIHLLQKFFHRSAVFFVVNFALHCNDTQYDTDGRGNGKNNIEQTYHKSDQSEPGSHPFQNTQNNEYRNDTNGISCQTVGLSMNLDKKTLEKKERRKPAERAHGKTAVLS